MFEPIIFVFAHVILGLLARLWTTGFNMKRVFVDEKLRTAGWVVGAILLGFLLWSCAGTR